ncbi:MAG: DegT/DnrJ/EryC1/StrS family aminotransferase [Candidatus Aenigmatarchaeota archaeon]
MIPISKPLIGKDEIDEVVRVLESGMLVQGEKVSELQTNFSNYLGVKYSVATNNGTTALELALRSIDTKEGDEIITTPFTFIASSNAILFCRAKPVFVDIDPETFNIDSNLIEEKITEKTKAILIVHLYGKPCNMDKIMAIAEKHNLKVIEDSCQAHGAEYKGKKVGSFGIGCFSFYATKNMTTGEGGMVTTDNREIAEKIEMLRNHGQEDRYYHKILGYNYRMTNMAAALGVVQLRKLDEMNEKRRENARVFTENLKSIEGLVTPKEEENEKHVFHQYTLRVTNKFPLSRDELVQVLKSNGVGTRIYYPVPVHKQDIYKSNESLTEAEKASDEVISIPVHPGLSVEDVTKIVEIIRSV